MLDLPVCAWVGDHGLVHPDIIIIIEIQEIFPDELGAIVGDDVVRDPKMKMMSWMKFTACLEPMST
jgi:hypothetical protein